MRKSWLLCVLLGSMALAQAAPPPPLGKPPADDEQAADKSASVAPDAPVITVNGVCPEQPAGMTEGKTSLPDCKTVVTKAEFEKLAGGLAPNMTPQLKRQLATILPRLIAMSSEARAKQLDKTERFDQMLKFAQMQILTNEMQRSIQEDAGKISETDVSAYYKEHAESFQQYNLDRLFVPRTKQADFDKDDDERDADKDKDKDKKQDEKAKEAAEKARAEANEMAMTKLADTLRARAAKGEDFVKLQKEAFEAAGMKIDSPTVNLPKIRRTGLPAAHAAVFDLKPGEVSQVINDAGGHYIYKVESKDDPTLDQVKDEIHTTLASQRSREMMDKVNASFKVDTSADYFGPGQPGMAPPPRMPSPRNMGPGGAPPAQPAPTKPN